jgi:hypothetical protein
MLFDLPRMTANQSGLVRLCADKRTVAGIKFGPNIGSQESIVPTCAEACRPVPRAEDIQTKKQENP